MAKTDVKVELFYSGVWNDITATNDVYSRDPITITRGRPDEVARIPPSTLNLSIANRSGRYSPRNPSSPLYGLIGRNTPIRVSVGSSVRFVGEVESWPQRGSVEGRDAWVPITANGILRRLNAPGTTRPAVSALRRAMLVGVMSVGKLVYWPLEEGADATQAASPMTGVGSLALSSAVTPGSVAGPQAGTLPYAVMDSSAAAFTTVTLPSSVAGFFAFSAVLKGTMPRPTTAKAVIYDPVKVTFTGGDIVDITVAAYARWTGTAFDTTSTGVDVIVNGGTSFGSVVGGFNVNMFDGNPHDIQVRLDQNGANIDNELWIDGVLVDTSTSAVKTLGTPAQLFAPVAVAGTLAGTAVDNLETTLGFGHYAVHTDATVPVVHDSAIAHVGEFAATRIQRLCTEDGIAFTLSGVAADSEPVGPQRIAPFLELLQDAADADDGILYEPRTSLGLAYRTHTSLYNRTLSLVLNYATGGEIAPPLLPVEDTDAIANDVTVTRLDGGSSTAVQATGPLNVQEPSVDPNGVGRYRKEITLVLATDSQTLPQATWRKHIGTSDDARYPVVNMDLTAMDVAGKAFQVIFAAGLDVGQRFNIASPPVWLPPDTIEQHAQGFTEVIESHRWSIAVNATPALPYDVYKVGTDTANRSRIPAALGESTLAGTMTTTSTSRTVTSVRKSWIDSAAFPAQFPFDVVVTGERMTVTAIVGTGLTQTFTVVRSVNGVVKTHAAAEAVQLFHPPVLAR